MPFTHVCVSALCLVLLLTLQELNWQIHVQVEMCCMMAQVAAAERSVKIGKRSPSLEKSKSLEK